MVKIEIKNNDFYSPVKQHLDQWKPCRRKPCNVTSPDEWTIEGWPVHTTNSSEAFSLTLPTSAVSLHQKYVLVFNLHTLLSIIFRRLVQIKRRIFPVKKTHWCTLILLNKNAYTQNLLHIIGQEKVYISES